MKHFIKFTIVALLFSVLISCKKESESLSPEQQQRLKEEKEVLQPNEMLEQEGLRFILSWTPQDSIQLNLKLYKGTGATKSPIPLTEDTRELNNYTIVTKGLENNIEFTLEVEYTQVFKPGTFDLTVIGFTAMPTTKRVTFAGNSFTTVNAGTKKDFLKITKGITKFTFFTL